jgi:tetratricopeptide (TPR) repeat protein
VSSPIPGLQATHSKRVTEWQRQFEELDKKLKEPGKSKAAEEELKPLRKAAAAAVERLTKEKDWWAWQLKANAENDPAKAEAIYREALNDFPESVELTGNFALFLQNVRQNYDEAERLYRKALELDPKGALHTGNFALFMQNVRRNYAEAERLYRKAVTLDPTNEELKKRLAEFLKEHPEFDKQ